MSIWPELESVRDVRWGKDSVLDAWLQHFKTENNVEHLMNPEKVATDEQLRFMVALDEDQMYFPCSDEVFQMLLQKEMPKNLLREYNRVWKFVLRLIREHKLDRYTERRIIQFCRHQFRLHLASHIMIPSRLVKRLVSIVLTQCAHVDPFREKKQRANKRAKEFLANPFTERVLLACPEIGHCSDMKEVRWKLDSHELRRLLFLSTMRSLWSNTPPSQLELETNLAKECDGCDCLRLVFGPEDEERKKILYLPDVSGGIIFDLLIIASLIRQGHQVVLALKEGFSFKSPTLWDIDKDPVLKEAVQAAHVLHDDTISKNDLLRMLREHRFLIISDGTREQLNLYKTSVTFARAWKECDIILAKGERNYANLIQCSHEFTRDIVCFYRDRDNERFHLQCKPRARGIRKFTEADLLGQADEIIQSMYEAKHAGKSVMFYSAVIGSIPGQTSVAISIVDTFVKHLREKMDNAFIINPAEHFEDGMDGDDLMFMWERVQRSGLLDVWRFQTVEDIETSFALQEKKVPSMWSGKDSTFSTGCTKEMHIAIDMQKKHPELQIIGPSPEKFFRRAEYGVGKYYDAGISLP